MTEDTRQILASMHLILLDDWSVHLEATSGNKIMHLGMLELVKHAVVTAMTEEFAESEKPEVKPNGEILPFKGN